MKVLHILKSEPDKTVEKLIGAISGNNESSVLSLYEEKTNWGSLVDYIFAYDKVICWW
jgi:hypothetical protein